MEPVEYGFAIPVIVALWVALAWMMIRPRRTRRRTRINPFDTFAHRAYTRHHYRLGGFLLGMANLSERKPWNGRSH